MRQHLGEILDAYMKRYEKALDCCDLVVEDVFVDIYLHYKIEVYRIYLENFSSWLMEPAR